MSATGERSIPTLLDISERMQSLDEFQTLTDNQKAMCITHVMHPTLNKSEIASRIGTVQSAVHAFFHSKKWDIINHELARQQIRELVQLSVHTLRSCMLNGTSSVKLDAATRVLTNAGLLLSPYGMKINKQDNKVVVLWKDDNSILPPGVASITCAINEGVLVNNGNKDTVLSPSKAEGST